MISDSLLGKPEGTLHRYVNMLDFDIFRQSKEIFHGCGDGLVVRSCFRYESADVPNLIISRHYCEPVYIRMERRPHLSVKRI